MLLRRLAEISRAAGVKLRQRGRRGGKKRWVEASVARCLRTPPDGA